MRKYLASSIGLACAAVLTLPCVFPAAAAGPGVRGPSSAAVPGSTQSFPLVPLKRNRTTGTVSEEGLTPRTVRSFSLVGVVWDDPGTELHGSVQVRTRAAGTNRWSGWQDLETHQSGHGPDPATAEGRSERMRGSTDPLWVGDSDGVEVRVRPEEAHAGETRAPALPNGLRVDLVDPGAETQADAPRRGAYTGALEGMPDADAGGIAQGAGTAASAVEGALASLGGPVIPAVPKETARETSETRREEALGAGPGSMTPYTAPRPTIVTRAGWGADESLREPDFLYTDSVKVAFVHHTATGNSYDCAEAPSVIRGIYRYHVVSNGWRDIGYNFLVDKCGNIYEGRAGGVEKPVMGAHTLGFNSNSTGVAVIGSFSGTQPSAASVTALAQLTAWKLGLHGMDPRGTTYLESAGGNLFPKGENVQLNVISGHRDGYATDCPGKQLYGKLGSVRSSAARLQGR
ncbi:hypothetical protein AAW14_15160 [Streptomyces hygroscopicus]|uniref:peptidoglycan recognition protein family protein n=1 Tax=Streptomyces hygroscopicus TaxID=1912 RepID=UPI0022406396|nr:peptidoglycan recognition protein [Streptomyces hygroscopicus]MCW7943347.1 hypothetical protein [Streptomyces hygroscopicus]